MLETIKDYINTLPDISFEQKFADYVLEMQAAAASTEVERMCNSSTFNIITLEKLILREIEGMKNGK